MPLASGFKRLGLIVATVIVIGGGGFVAASLLIPAQVVRDAVIQEIRTATGLEPRIEGEVSLALFPASTVTFNNVVLKGDGQEPALVAQSLIARLRLLSLLIGRIETTDITLDHPNITVAFDAEGRSNWASLGDKLSATLKPRTRRLVSFSEIRIVGGTIALRDPNRELAEDLTDIEASLAWPAIAKSFGATGRFTWRAEPVVGTVTLGDLYAVLVGERSGIKARLTGGPGKLALDGSVSHRPSFKLEGVVSLDGPSLRRLAEWLGHDLPPGNGFGGYALKAQAHITPGVVSLPQLTAEFDGNAAEGVLTVKTGRKPAVQGTLASESIDLTRYLSAIQVFRGREREWNRTKLDFDALQRMDVDIRFSAARLQIGNSRLQRIAAAANLMDGKLSLTLGESTAFGGIVKGAIGLQPTDDEVRITSSIQFSDVDIESCLQEVFGIRRLAGKGDLVLALNARGPTVMALTHSLNGTADLVAKGGALSGLNVEQLLRRLERRPLSGGGNFRTGSTAFDRVTVKLKIVDGTASVDEVLLDGSAVRLALAGSASIPSRDLDLKGTASLVTNAANNFELPFVVQGPWDDPIMLPDTQMLLRRSGAAAPLLNAIRPFMEKNAPGPEAPAVPPR